LARSEDSQTLTAKEKGVLQDAIKNGFIINTSATRWAVAAYSYWCEVNGRPVIEIRQNTKYSSVHVDFITVPGSSGYSEEASQKVQKLVLETYRLDLKPKSSLGLGGIYTHFYIKNELAPQIAAEMWKLAIEDM
jgi:hypothetical protein